ncbi:hypothetical protein [Geoglobus acetivorans]|uniref:Uncharacterized protein n=1 Tax=Geoglobus acetivorans TaxID=565033 RepID=A0A0A7GEQ2_GEOAI|nr:hypothetical protein GACE_0383 [Geoglobus acetivorans]
MRGEIRVSASVETHAEIDYRTAICRACDFYKPGDTLECAGYKVLKYFVETGRLTLEEIELAASQACRKGPAEEVRQ